MNHGNTEHLLVEALQVLEKGGVVLHPTETCYGLAADIFYPEAVEKIYLLKEMSRSKPVSIMVSSLEEAEVYGVFNQQARILARAFWPGPLTIIVKRAPELPSYINPGIDSVGIRCPDHAFTLEMLRRFEEPLITTSANRTGEPQAYEVDEFLENRIEDMIPDFIVDMGRIPETAPSTIVDLSGESGVDMVIVRHGPISVEAIHHALRGE